MSAKKPSAADWQVGDEVVVANVNHQARRSVVTKVGRKLVHVAGQPAPFDASEYPCKTQSLYGHVSLWRLDDYQFRCRVEAIGTELADAKAECQGAMLSAYAQYAETVRERDEAREAMASVVEQLRGRDEETQRLVGTLRERNEAKEFARVLEVERDTLLAENAKLRGEVAEQRVLLRWFLDGDDHTHEDDCGARGSHDLDVCRAAPCLDDCEGPHCACGATEMRARALAALEAP